MLTQGANAPARPIFVCLIENRPTRVEIWRLPTIAKPRKEAFGACFRGLSSNTLRHHIAAPFAAIPRLYGRTAAIAEPATSRFARQGPTPAIC